MKFDKGIVQYLDGYCVLVILHMRKESMQVATNIFQQSLG